MRPRRKGPRRPALGNINLPKPAHVEGDDAGCGTVPEKMPALGDHRMNSPITFFKVGKDGRLIAPPGMSKKEAAVHRQSIRAWEHWHETGDTSKLREAGLLPPEDSE